VFLQSFFVFGQNWHNVFYLQSVNVEFVVLFFVGQNWHSVFCLWSALPGVVFFPLQSHLDLVMRIGVFFVCGCVFLQLVLWGWQVAFDFFSPSRLQQLVSQAWKVQTKQKHTPKLLVPISQSRKPPRQLWQSSSVDCFSCLNRGTEFFHFVFTWL